MTEPVEFKNTKIGELYYKEYVVDKKSQNVQIKGITEPGAEIKAYVVYDNVNFEYKVVPDEFKNYSTVKSNGSVNVGNNTNSSENSDLEDYDHSKYYVAFCKNCGAAFLNPIYGEQPYFCSSCLNDPDVRRRFGLVPYDNATS